MRFRFPICLIAAAMVVGSISRANAEALPVFSPTGPDALAYGSAQAYPVLRGGSLLPQLYMVGDYSHYATLWPSHTVARAATASVLHRAADELTLTYRYQGVSLTLDNYLQRNPATGLLIARDGTILYEHYQYARTDRDLMLSQSMAKTITSLLVGLAVSEGAIRSIDQPAADYVPELAGSEYGKTPIRALLHMASGMAFSERYDGADDSARLGRALFGAGNPGAERVVASFDVREVPAGTRFHYAGIETEILGLVVTHAVHMSLAAYLQSRIWQPMGAESDAAWTVDSRGQEVAYCCFNATLRDWGRLALLLSQDGMWNGKQIIPRSWMIAATSVEAPWLAPGSVSPSYGYGYQVWLLAGARRQFALLGIHGQTIFVDPMAHVVMVQTAVRLKPSADPSAAELRAVWQALVEQHGHSVRPD